MSQSRSIVLLAAMLALAAPACLNGSSAASDGGPHADAATAADASVSTPPDAGAPDSGGVRPDAGVTCTGDSCLSNLDCAAQEFCQSLSATTTDRCCVTGARGDGVAGFSCTSDRECAIGLCLARDDGQKFCAGPCQSDLECPGTMKCSDIFHWCYPLDVGTPPRDCDSIGLPQCAYNDNCQDNERCENKGTAQVEVLCCTVGARGTKAVGESCASGLDCAFGRCLGGLCSEMCDETTDPCPPATMQCSLYSYMCEPL